MKVSANAENTKYYIGDDIYIGIPDVKWNTIAFIEDSKLLWTHGCFYAELPDLSNLITNEEFSPVSDAAYGSIQKGTLGTINGESIEDGNINIDLSLYKIVSELPTEDILDNKIYFVPNSASTAQKNIFDEYIYNTSVTPAEWELLGQYQAEVDLSAYLKTADADTKYMPKGASSTSGSSLSISQTGSFNNYGDNGQAFNAVRDLSKTTKWQAATGSGYPLNAASFGVKDNGTTAFSHKKYDTFDKETGKYTGAKNTAVLVFSGKSGLLYAKNTGSGNDVTDDMYKRVGVIDSPDEAQRCYSAKQVDDLLKSLTDEIDKLKSAVIALGGTVD